MATTRKPDAEAVINGRLVRAWNRRSEIDVDVYAVAKPDLSTSDQLVGEWGMPKPLGLNGAMRQAEAQTDR